MSFSYLISILFCQFKCVLQLLKSKVLCSNDKAIVVSQWTTVLSMFSFFLDKQNVSHCQLTGAVPVKMRNEIVNDFNNQESNTKVIVI